MKMLEEGQNQPQIAHKRTKLQEEIAEKGEEDRISSLPDCLLLDILSCLPSTKDAIRTSTLSKRWTHLWTLLPKLTFVFVHLLVSQAHKNPSSYILLLDKTLTQCRQSNLEIFKLRVPYDSRFESLFNNWIRFSLSCNVKELYLDFWYSGRETEFRLDQSLCINSHITDLTLLGCMLNPIGAISWPNLRSLSISHMNLDEDLVLNLLCGCPLLETWVLQSSHVFNPSDESESEAEADIININAPNTLSLTQYPQLNLKKFKVSTYYHIGFESQLNTWIRYAIRCNVQEFILKFENRKPGYEFKSDQIVFTRTCFTKLELNGCMLNPVGAISWKNLRSLCISSQSLKEDLISKILSGSPVLESLELYDCCGYKRLDITSKSVKNLVIAGFRIPHDESENDTVEINAPNILSLTMQLGLTLGKLLLVDVSSLVKARLDYCHPEFNDDNRDTMPKETEEEILKGYINVKELQIGYFCSKAVSCLQAQGFVFPSNVKFLKGAF